MPQQLTSTGRRSRGPVWPVALALFCLAGAGEAQEARKPAESGPGDASSRFKKMSLAELMEIEVTSVSRRPQKLAQSPSAIQVITGGEIRRSGASSIPESLRLADNLAVAQKNSHDWAISARGFNTDLANKLLVLIDGRAVYTPLFSGVLWNQQDYLLEDIDRIEVISGPGGSLWGANAVNGVINVITKGAEASQGGYLEAGGGDQLERFIGGRFGGEPSPAVHLRGYGKYFERDNEALPGGGEAHDAWRMGQGGFRLDARRGSKNHYTVQGDTYVGREHLGAGGEARFWGGNLMGRWTRTSSERLTSTLQVYYDRTHLTLPVPASLANGTLLAPAGVLKDDLHTLDIDLQSQRRIGTRHHLLWGLGFRFTHNVVANAPGLAFLPETLNRNLYSGFAQDELSLSDRVALTLGSKVEHNDYTGFEVEPSARLRWNITSRHIAWAAVSRAVRMPSRVDRHQRLPTPALAPLVQNLLIGSANFKSETVVSYEVGLRAEVGTRLSASIAGFYNRYDNLRSTSLSPPPATFSLPLFYANDLEGETRGLELSVDYQASDWWLLHAGGALLGEDIRVKPGKFDFNRALNETADPASRYSLRSAMNLSRALELDLTFRFVDSFRFNASGSPAVVPSYQELDARLLWHAAKKLDVTLAGRNLLNNHHAEYVISGPNPRGEIRRSVYGKLILRW